MSKQEQIDELKKGLEKGTATARAWRDEAYNLKQQERERKKRESDAKRADEGYAKLAEQGRVAATKLAREQEALDLLKLGYVKVETLRNAVLAEYDVNTSPGLDITKFTLRLRSTNRVEDALRVAILEKPKPKFATGGYIGNTNLQPVGDVHPTAFYRLNSGAL